MGRAESPIRDEITRGSCGISHRQVRQLYTKRISVNRL